MISQFVKTIPNLLNLKLVIREASLKFWNGFSTSRIALTMLQQYYQWSEIRIQ
jgi:hypothetical protein